MCGRIALTVCCQLRYQKCLDAHVRSAIQVKCQTAETARETKVWRRAKMREQKMTDLTSILRWSKTGSIIYGKRFKLAYMSTVKRSDIAKMRTLIVRNANVIKAQCSPDV